MPLNLHLLIYKVEYPFFCTSCFAKLPVAVKRNSSTSHNVWKSLKKVSILQAKLWQCFLQKRIARSDVGMSIMSFGTLLSLLRIRFSLKTKQVLTTNQKRQSCAVRKRFSGVWCMCLSQLFKSPIWKVDGKKLDCLGNARTWHREKKFGRRRSSKILCCCSRCLTPLHTTVLCTHIPSLLFCN